MLALVNGVPETMSLKGILENFIAHRVTVIRRRTEYDLRKALEREHILLGLKKALDHLYNMVSLQLIILKLLLVQDQQELQLRN